MAVTVTMTSKGHIAGGDLLVRDYGSYVTTGAGTGTLSVSGGYVIEVLFFDNNNNILDSSTGTTAVLSAESITGGATTITITAGATAITAGSYVILHGGG